MRDSYKSDNYNHFKVYLIISITLLIASIFLTIFQLGNSGLILVIGTSFLFGSCTTRLFYDYYVWYEKTQRSAHAKENK